MRNKTGLFIKDVLEEMDGFNSALKVHAYAEFERVSGLTEDQNSELQEQMSDGMILLMEDRDILTSHLEASKENLDSKISDKETEIVKTLQEDWRQTESRILEEQHTRNRNIIEEIIKTCENFREEIRKLPPLKFYYNVYLVSLMMVADVCFRERIQKTQRR